MGFFDEVKSVNINNKEVQKIEATIDNVNVLIWEKEAETVSSTVRIIWNDNNDRLGRRPSYVRCSLNGVAYNVIAAEGWTLTISGLPKYVDGVEQVYIWQQQSILGYTTSVIVDGNNTTFTNTMRTGPTPPPVI